MKNLASFICAHCGAQGQKSAQTLSRNRTMGLLSYCSRLCANRSYRLANKERLHEAETRRRSRPEVRDNLRKRGLGYYYQNRELFLERCKKYREANPEKVAEAIKRWRAENPDKVEIYTAKSIFTRSAGLRWADIPNDLAAAKAEQLKIARLVREMLASDSGRHPEGEKPQALSGAAMPERPCEDTASPGNSQGRTR